MRSRKWLFLLVFCLVRPALADKLDKDAKKWLDDVAMLLTPEEEKTYRGLKDKADRDEFEKIFWARRNPKGPESPENEIQASYEKAKAQADLKFKSGKGPGSQTDCGKVFFLIGEPNETKKLPPSAEGGPGGPSQVWTFRDRPGFTFPDGHMEISFDSSCQLPEGTHLSERLHKLAERLILNANIGYKLSPAGHLTKLADQLPKPSATQTLLKEPRQDFPVTAETSIVWRLGDADYIAGLLRGDGSSLTTLLSPDGKAPEKKMAKVSIAVAAIDDAGKRVATPERETTVELQPDGSFLVSFGVSLKPGTYTLKAGVLDPKSGKGSVASVPVEAPDYAGAELAVAPLLVLKDIQQVQTKDQQDPLADFTLAAEKETNRFVPRFGNVFSPTESLTILGTFYNGKVDPATGKASVGESIAIMKDGNVVAQAAEQTFDIPNSSAVAGPVPLTKYAPGKYVAVLKVRDLVTKKEYKKEAGFEVR